MLRRRIRQWVGLGFGFRLGLGLRLGLGVIGIEALLAGALGGPLRRRNSSEHLADRAGGQPDLPLPRTPLTEDRGDVFLGRRVGRRPSRPAQRLGREQVLDRKAVRLGDLGDDGPCGDEPRCGGRVA
jgi:hypothetical protein